MGTRTDYLPAVDGLRAIAVLAVVAYHAGLPLAGGFVGVDIFFVISGYLITRILQQQLEESGRVSYRDFYARRIRRIYPALVTVVATTIALSAVLGAAGQERVVASALASLAMVGNFHFQAVTGGYFDASSDHMPLLHLWSLGVEEQFYLIWPLVLPAIVRGTRSALLVIAATSLGLAEWWLRSNPEAAFYQMPARAWELAGGAWLALRPLPATAPRWMGVAGLLLVIVGIIVPAATGHFPGMGALPAVAGSMLLIHGARDTDASVNRILASRPFVYVGLISYSLYLWHWPLLAIHRAATMVTTLSISIALCVVAVGLAALTYRYIETPMRRTHRPGRTGAVALICAACLAMVLAPAPQRPATPAAHAGKAEWGCMIPYGRRAPTQPGCRPEDATVVLWGDSHAQSWRPFADMLGTVAEYSMSSCTPVLGLTIEVENQPMHSGVCEANNLAAVEHVTRGIGTVVIAAYLYGFEDRLPYVSQAVDAVAGSADRIIVMMPTPLLPHTPEECNRIGISCAVPINSYYKRTERVRAAFLTIAAAHPNVEILETADFFCTATECPTVLKGMPLYMDAHHITPLAARAFGTEVLSSGSLGASIPSQLDP